MRTEFYVFCFCPLYVHTTFKREGGEECQGVAGGYLYLCFVMNEALECSPNYTHTRSSTTRSHVRASDLRLAAKEIEADISS